MGILLFILAIISAAIIIAVSSVIVVKGGNDEGISKKTEFIKFDDLEDPIASLSGINDRGK